MSLTRVRIAFGAALRFRVGATAHEELWQSFAQALVMEAGNESLWIPGSVPDPAAVKRQGDLFAVDQDAGLSIREIASKAKMPKSTVHRILSQRGVGLGTAA